ncbi:aminoglycoside adenylyltransferase domain-containing protein [Oceanobacillus manasiensis]|uniref:aminoglycoside adenylyltransferase domain-containing protein n=1 Tax=Oceanobacillus manasiensis TaxID=586413 RepID=UPI000A05CCCE|nr:aminoglycoside adenylyltransferase domain-containing protein [Oceanobacillus manasiensis]
MGDSWQTCSEDVRRFVLNFINELEEIIKGNSVGFYLHGSLAMGGFNPNSSDIDILIVTNKSLNMMKKRELAKLFLTYSTNPYPLEISVLTINHLTEWVHPCPFDFHYSEYWRKRYEEDLLHGTSNYLNDELKTNPDLAAHITITKTRGVCLKGQAIHSIFPSIPKAHYISSILGDYYDCLNRIETDPVYCTLNLLRVYWYLREGVISSKEEASQWGIKSLPSDMAITVHKVAQRYRTVGKADKLEAGELMRIREFIANKVQDLIILEGITGGGQEETISETNRS